MLPGRGRLLAGSIGDDGEGWRRVAMRLCVAAVWGRVEVCGCVWRRVGWSRGGRWPGMEWTGGGGWSGSGLGLHMGWAEYDDGLVGRISGFSGSELHNPINSY